MQSARTITREIGTALAVLAIYLLTMLAPLHEARASQLVFEELGYSTLVTGWVICTSQGADGGDNDISVVKCPATGIGKHDLIAPSLDVLPAGLDLTAVTIQAAPVSPAFLPAPTAPPGGPRAPPASV